jgi:hypothetical protein
MSHKSRESHRSHSRSPPRITRYPITANGEPPTANCKPLALPQLFLQIGDDLLQLFQLALHGWEPF